MNIIFYKIMEPYKRQKELIYASQDTFFAFNFDSKDVLLESSVEANVKFDEKKQEKLLNILTIYDEHDAEHFAFLLAGKYLGTFYIYNNTIKFSCIDSRIIIKDCIAESNSYNGVTSYNLVSIQKKIASFFSSNPKHLLHLKAI